MKIFLLSLFAFLLYLFVPQIIFAQSNCPLSEADTKSNQDLINNCSIAELSTLSNDRLSSFSLDFLSQFSNDRLLLFSNDFLLKFPNNILKQFPADRVKTFPCDIQIQLGYSCGEPTNILTPSPIPTPLPSSSTIPTVKKPLKIMISQYNMPDQFLDPNDPSSMAKVHLNFEANGRANLRFQVNYDESGQDYAIYYAEYKLKSASSLPSPDQNGITHITSCQEITKPGNYILDQNLSYDGDTCFTIRDINDVNFDCSSHSILTGVSEKSFYSFYVINSKNIHLKSCNITSDPGHLSNLQFNNVENGSISSSSIQYNIVSIFKSKNIVVNNNQFNTSEIRFTETHNSEISSNSFTIDENSKYFKEIGQKAAYITSSSGSSNRIINNTMDGKSDGVFMNKRGMDDGIVLGSEIDLLIGENQNLVQNNTISNVYDCGIEGTGLVQNNIISDNRIDNTGTCGIGAWWSSSWRGNTVSNNFVNNSPSSLNFFYVRKVEQAPQVYFIDNTFNKNKLTNQRIPPATPVLMNIDDFITKGNNLLADNDFGLNQIPVLLPGTMIIDGGNNVCLQATNKDFPLKCIGQTGESVKRVQNITTQELNNLVKNQIQTVESGTRDSNKQLPTPAPTPTPRPLKLIDFNNDGVINIFDYIIYAQKKLGR